MEPASASRFANALSLALLQELGWNEVPLTEPVAPPILRMNAHLLGALVVLKGDGLPLEAMASLTEAWWQRLGEKQLSKTWQVLGLLIVFESGASPEMRAAVANLTRQTTFSTRRILVGSVDLLDGTADLKGERRLDFTKTLARVLGEWRAGEARVDTAAYRQSVQAEVDRTEAFVGRLAKTRPWGTWAIFALCVAMFAWMELAGGSTRVLTLVRFGADYGPLVRQGEWWRLVGGMFLHIGAIHLIVNMLAVLAVGRAIEQFFGNARYLTLYLIAGVAGAIASASMRDIVSAGASGALFGLFGAAVLLGVRYRAEIPPALRRRIAGGMITCIGFNLFLGFTIPGIDNSAHIGGLLAGALFAAIIPPAVIEGEEEASASLLTPFFLVVGLSMFAVEGYVAWRAMARPEIASERTWTHKDPKGRYEASLPISLGPCRSEGEDVFLGPGFEFHVFLYVEQVEHGIAEEADALIDALNGGGIRVSGSQLKDVGGRTWLLMDTKSDKPGPARFAVTAHGRVRYRLIILAGEAGLEEANRALDRILEGFRPLARE